MVMYLIRKLQNAVRARFRVRLLTQYRVALLRPMHVTIMRCSNLAIGDTTGFSDPYIVMTVIDANSTENQSWSFQTSVKDQTLNPVYNERFMIPGLSGKQILVFTVVDEDEVRHQCLGQATFKMGPPGDAWKHGGSYIINITNVKYIPKVAGTNLRVDYSGVKPTGSIEVCTFFLIT
jgi:hypothetical protein